MVATRIGVCGCYNQLSITKVHFIRGVDMGITYIEGTVSGPSGPGEQVRFLVDSGASYTLLPETTWKAIQLEPQRSMAFSLADGTIVERKISECLIELAAGKCHTPVVL